MVNIRRIRKFFLQSVARLHWTQRCASMQRLELAGILICLSSRLLSSESRLNSSFTSTKGVFQDMLKEYGSPTLCPEGVVGALPFLSLPVKASACYEAPGQGGGYLRPRDLVRAQKKIAQDQGCTMVDGLVTGLVKDGNIWKIETQSGEYFYSKAVALCQGTYSGLSFLAKDLLPPLDLTFTAQTTALIEVDEEEAERLELMPSMVIQVTLWVLFYQV